MGVGQAPGSHFVTGPFVGALEVRGASQTRPNDVGQITQRLHDLRMVQTFIANTRDWVICILPAARSTCAICRTVGWRVFRIGLLRVERASERHTKMNEEQCGSRLLTKFRNHRWSPNWPRGRGSGLRLELSSVCALSVTMQAKCIASSQVLWAD